MSSCVLSVSETDAFPFRQVPTWTVSDSNRAIFLFAREATTPGSLTAHTVREVGVEPTCYQTTLSTVYRTEGIFADKIVGCATGLEPAIQRFTTSCFAR